MDVSTLFPRQSNSNGLVIIKLKRKLEYRDHVDFEPVRPDIVLRLLRYLKANNDLFKDVTIVPSDIPTALVDSLENKSAELADLDSARESLELEESYLDRYRIVSNETLISNILEIHEDVDKEGVVSVAPGKGKKPMPIFKDNYCEEHAFPHLFPTGKLGYKVQRDIPMSPVKYFNQRLLNCSQKFASDSDYIFFVHSVLQQMQISNQINIAMTKVATTNLTAGKLRRSFKQTVQQFIASDEAFSFMNTIKGTPAYWKKCLHEVLEMVK